jgi:large subunit ribosomal protein L24
MGMLKAKSSKKRVDLPQHYHVKTGDTVMVIAGKDRGKTGTIKRVFRNKGSVIVEGLNKIKKAVRPNPMVGQSGGIIEMEAPLNVSKVMLYDLKNNQPSRAKIQRIEGKPVRVAKKSGEHFDE